MEKAKFKLPGSSLPELEKIIEAYGQRSGPASNEDVSKLAGVNHTTVSRNNGFLVAAGIVSGGQKKEATDLGKKLARALHHEQQKDVARFWQEVVGQSPFLSEQLTAVRVQKGVKRDDLPGRILYSLGVSKKTGPNEAGARALADMFVKAGLLKEVDEVLQVPTADTSPEPEPPQPSSGEPTLPPAEEVEQQVSYQPTVSKQPFQIAINLQLQIPEFEDPQKYEELFSALRKHLLSTEDPDGS